jgi:hypothetical protein
MILEAVIISVGYSDFLAHTLTLNKGHFNKLVVVTSTADKATQKLCEYHHVQCIQTDVFYENGDVFNKAKGINAGLAALTQAGWVLHLDSDMVLPPLFRDTLEPIGLDETFVYGVDRLMCTNYEDWAKHMVTPHLTQEASIYIHPHNETMPMGTRIAKYATAEGYIPIGFFQLWNPGVSGINHYPQGHGDAGRSDMLFAMQWSRRKRGFIPEIVTIHLESEKLTQMGKNWKGRKTRHFGPVIELPIPEEVEPVIELPIPEEVEPVKEVVCYGCGCSCGMQKEEVLLKEPIMNEATPIEAPVVETVHEKVKKTKFQHVKHKFKKFFFPIAGIIVGAELLRLFVN